MPFIHMSMQNAIGAELQQGKWGTHEHAYLNRIFLNNGFEHACLMSGVQSYVHLNLSCLCF